MVEGMREEISDRLRAAVWSYFWLQVLLVASGLVLLIVYRGPDAAEAANSFRGAQESWFWRTLAGMHYWGSFLSLATCVPILMVLFLQGVVGEGRRYWMPLLAVFLISLASQVTGNALPADRHDVRTVNVEASIASRAPILGESLGRIALQGDEFTPGTLTFWKNLHIGLGVASLAVIVWLYSLLRKRSPKSGFEVGVALSIPVLATVAGIAIPRATGTAFELADRSSFVAQPSWYVLPLHALLKLFESIDRSLGWVGSMLVPGLAVLVAILVPLWAHRMPDVARRGLLLACLASLGLLMAFYGSVPAPISGVQPVHDMASGAKGGPIAMELSARGAKLYAENCAGCHGKSGVGTPAAPKLTEVHRINSDPEYYIRFLRNPKSANPSSTMPSFSHLPNADLKALAEWLRDPNRD